MRVFQQPAYILHTSEYRETSLLVEAYSRDHGRIGLIAKGARRAKNGLRGVLNSLQPLLLSWSGKGDMPMLTAAEFGAIFISLSGQNLYCGFYMNELIVRLMHRHDPHEQLFDAYQRTLLQLHNGESQDMALRIFEKKLLQELGYGLVLDHNVDTKAPVEAQTLYEYMPERGPVSGNVNDMNGGILVHGRTLTALAIERFNDDLEYREAKMLMRSMLAKLLNGRPLRSRDLFQRLKPAEHNETTG